MNLLLKIATWLGLTTKELCEGLWYCGTAAGNGILIGKTATGKRLLGLASPEAWRLTMGSFPNGLDQDDLLRASRCYRDNWPAGPVTETMEG